MITDTCSSTSTETDTSTVSGRNRSKPYAYLVAEYPLVKRRLRLSPILSRRQQRFPPQLRQYQHRPASCQLPRHQQHLPHADAEAYNLETNLHRVASHPTPAITKMVTSAIRLSSNPQLLSAVNLLRFTRLPRLLPPVKRPQL